MGDFVRQFVPLVAIGGWGGSDNLLSVPYSVEDIPLPSSELDDASPAKDILDRLMARSTDPTFWSTAAVAQAPALHLKQFASLSLCKKMSPPSVLSPRNKNSVLYPDLVFSVDWVRKYLYLMPTSVMMWYRIDSATNVHTLTADILALKAKLDIQRAHLLVVLINVDIPPPEYSARATEIRKATGLAARTGLLCASSDFSAVEIDTFVESTWQLLVSQAADFYAGRSRDVREKRNRLDTIRENSLWETRYTFKLACFAEFKFDYHGALRLYESSYDCLLGMFDDDVTVENVPAWRSARHLLDVCALKIFKGLLYQSQYASIARKFAFHLERVRTLLIKNGIDIGDSISYTSWTADSIFQLAKLLDASKASFRSPKWACSPSQDENAPALASLPRSGFLYLHSTELYRRMVDDTAPKGHNIVDPYWQKTEDNSEAAFEGALDDLAPFSNSKARALVEFGRWYMHKGDLSSAISCYQKAVNSLNPRWYDLAKSLYKEIQTHAGTDTEKATAALGLFSVGDVSDLKAAGTAVADNIILFTAVGNFQEERTYVGRTLKGQLTLTPKFSGDLQLDSIKIQLTVGSIILKRSASSGEDHIEVGLGESVVNICFQNGRAKTFDLVVCPSEPGELEFVDLQIFCKQPTFSQRLSVSSTNIWFDNTSGVRSKSVLRMKPLSHVEVLTRPAKLFWGLDKVPRVVAAGENVGLYLSLLNEEDVQSHVSVTVGIKSLTAEGEIQDNICWQESFELDSQGLEKIKTPMLELPRNSFRFIFKADYTTNRDKVPVNVSSSVGTEIQQPLRISFSLSPHLDADPWPSSFIIASTLPHSTLPKYPMIARSWELKALVLGMFSSPILIHRSELEIQAMDGTVVPNTRVSSFSPELLKYNEWGSVSFVFQSDKTVDIEYSTMEAALSLWWSRQDTPELLNVYRSPAIRLNLPSHEPRVLAVADYRNQDEIALWYYIENGTRHVLNFAVTMQSSSEFTFQGPKALSLRMLPFSRRVLHYRAIPTVLQPKGGLPDLRVYDTNYKRILSILPGNDSLVILENGGLKLESNQLFH